MLRQSPPATPPLLLALDSSELPLRRRHSPRRGTDGTALQMQGRPPLQPVDSVTCAPSRGHCTGAASDHALARRACGRAVQTPVLAVIFSVPFFHVLNKVRRAVHLHQTRAQVT